MQAKFLCFDEIHQLLNPMHTSALCAGISVQWGFCTDHGVFTDGFLCYAILEAAEHKEKQGLVLKEHKSSYKIGC